MKEQKDPVEYVTEEDKMHRGGLVNEKLFEISMAEKVNKDAKDRPEQLMNLAEKTAVARKALIEALSGVGDAIETFEPKSAEYIRQIRAFSSSGVLEIRNLMRSFEDVRKFFLSDQHAIEVQRLVEFVTLCERLYALKQSGFLDAITDTILNLECRTQK